MSNLPLLKDNEQPPEKPVPVAYEPGKEGDGGAALVEVVGDPWYTIQGEGPFAGMPAVFVRLAGCNLQCTRCDTDYTSGRNSLSVAALVRAVKAADGIRAYQLESTLVVITGGEPFRQAALDPLVRRLLEAGYRVQIETNGTIWNDDMPVMHSDLSIVVSPKTPTIKKEFLDYAAAFKYVVADGGTGDDGLPTAILGSPCVVARPPKLDWRSHFRRAGGPFEVYVQAEDSADDDARARNLTAAVEACMTHGYRLSVQLHKVVGLP